MKDRNRVLLEKIVANKHLEDVKLKILIAEVEKEMDDLDSETFLRKIGDELTEKTRNIMSFLSKEEGKKYSRHQILYREKKGSYIVILDETTSMEWSTRVVIKNIMNFYHKEIHNMDFTGAEEDEKEFDQYLKIVKTVTNLLLEEEF